MSMQAFDHLESAHFIAHLERTYGADGLRALSQRLGQGTEPGAAFEEALGAALVQVTALFIDYNRIADGLGIQPEPGWSP